MASDLNRPAVLTQLSISQAEELQAQADEGDREGFDMRTQAYGWSASEADAVWEWLTSTPPDMDDLESVTP